ncbi:MAG: HNH endonuclease signature motif containing protein [archaeon]
MARNPFGIEPIIDINIYGSQRSRKRTLGVRDKQILYRRAKGRCEACGKKIEYDEMQVGHKKPYSKGGATTLANSACLCYRCNKLQGTDSLETLKKKMAGTFGKRTKKGSGNSARKKTRSGGNYWINPITGRKEKIQPLFRL